MHLMLTSVLLTWTRPTSISKRVCSSFKTGNQQLVHPTATLLYLRMSTLRPTSLPMSMVQPLLSGAHPSFSSHPRAQLLPLSVEGDGTVLLLRSESLDYPLSS